MRDLEKFTTSIVFGAYIATFAITLIGTIIFIDKGLYGAIGIGATFLIGYLIVRAFALKDMKEFTKNHEIQHNR